MASKRIVWFSWKDIEHPRAGGAEVVTDQLLTKAVEDGHKAVLICSGYKGAEHESMRHGYQIIRVGNRLTVYLAAWRYYRKHLRGLADIAIDECNTVPFFAGRFTGKATKHYLFFHMLCRKIWFYQLPTLLGLAGYLAEPIYLRLLKHYLAITVSDSTRRDLQRHGFKDVSVISEGITLKPANLRTIKKYAQPTLLSLGSVRDMKRTLDQVKAFEIAKQQIPKLKLIIAGDHDNTYGRRVQYAVAASPYRNDITMLGRVSNAKKQELMQRCHVLLVTSVKEGWGLVVTEAASQGTPSVVYDVDGLRDSVKANKTGIITKEAPAALAKGAVQLLQDKVFYATMRETAYDYSKGLTFERAYADFKEVVRL